MEPIKLYAPEKYRESKLDTHIGLLFPFWGVTTKESAPYVRAAFLQYQYSKNDFTLVQNIEDCDYVVVPYSYDRLKKTNPNKLAGIISEAQRAGKPLIIDGAGDIEHPIDVANSIILRVSQYRYSKKPNEITIPFPAEDLLETYASGELKLREKTERPVVGFTGWVSVSAKMRLKLWVKELPISLMELIDKKRGAEHKGILFRQKAIRALSRNPHVGTNFIRRASYSGNIKTIEGSVENNRREFVENLLNSDYALCVKGDANSSVRFYDALSLGRIPLFVDTACVLPLEDTINYRYFCIFVDWRDIDNIGDTLADFHKKVSDERFKDMQIKARNAYLNYFRLDSFSAHLAALLRERKSLFKQP